MRKIFLLLVFLSPMAIFAQLENIPLVTVTGESVINVVPDYAIIGLKMTKSLPTILKTKPAFAIFEESETKIRLYGLDNKFITSSLIQYDSLAYFKEIYFQVTDLTKLDKYLLDLINQGYRKPFYIEYRLSNLAELKEKTRLQAVEQARTKAQQMAVALGQTIGSAHTIDEIPTETINWYQLPDKKVLRNLTWQKGSDFYLAEPGFITITSRVKVSFDLIKN